MDKLAIQLKAEEFREVTEVNMVAPLMWTQEIIRRARWMQKAKEDGGRVAVYIGSIVGNMGNLGQLAYSSSKGALTIMNRVLAGEFKEKGIRFAVVAPGFVRTDMTEHLPDKIKESARSNTMGGKFIEPKDVAYQVVHLLSKESNYITGATLEIDGGLTLPRRV